MKLKRVCAPLLSLFLCTGAAAEVIDKETANSIQDIAGEGINYSESSKPGFDIINKKEDIKEEWPDYMEWMRDLRGRIYDIKIAVNSLSNASREDRQLFYLDPNLNEKSVTFYIYKRKF